MERIFSSIRRDLGTGTWQVRYYEWTGDELRYAESLDDLPDRECARCLAFGGSR